MRQLLTFRSQFDLQRDAAARGAGAGAGGRVPLFTAAATAAAANNNKENTYRRRSSSLKEGSPLKAPVPKGTGTKRARVSASVQEEGDAVDEQSDQVDVEVLERADKKKKSNGAGGGRGRRMSEAESAAVIMGESAYEDICIFVTCWGFGCSIQCAAAAGCLNFDTILQARRKAVVAAADG